MAGGGGQRRRAGRGRPALLSRDEILDAVIECGLNRFTVADVAQQLGVRKSTMYNYIESRDRLYTMACARLFERLDVTSHATSWTDYLVEVNIRIAAMAAAHPGLATYLVSGRYEQSTLDVFAQVGSGLRGWLPDADDDVLHTVAGQVTAATMSLLVGQGPAEAAAVEPLRPMVRQFVAGAEKMLGSGAVVAHSWQDFQASTRITAAPRRAAGGGPQQQPGLDLAGLRKELGITQQEVASRLGVDQASVSRLENHADPAFGQVMAYLSALGTSPRLLVTIGGSPRSLQTGSGS